MFTPRQLLRRSMPHKPLYCRWSFRPVRTEDHSRPGRKLLPHSLIKRTQTGRETRPVRALDGFNNIRLTLLERIAGTTRLELATSAVTVLIWNFKDLRAPEGTEKRVKEQKGTLIVPALFPDSGVGNSEPDRGRIGTDVLQERTQGSTDRKQYRAESRSWISLLTLTRVAHAASLRRSFYFARLKFTGFFHTFISSFR